MRRTIKRPDKNILRKEDGKFYFGIGVNMEEKKNRKSHTLVWKLVLAGLVSVGMLYICIYIGMLSAYSEDSVISNILGLFSIVPLISLIVVFLYSIHVFNVGKMSLWYLLLEFMIGLFVLSSFAPALLYVKDRVHMIQSGYGNLRKISYLIDKNLSHVLGPVIPTDKTNFSLHSASWTDELLKLDSTLEFDHPMVEPTKFDIAFNSNLSGRNLNEVPDDVVLFFESSGGKNLSGGLELLYKRKGTPTFIMLANGDVHQYIFRKEGYYIYDHKEDKRVLKKLRWKF